MKTLLKTYVLFLLGTLLLGSFSLSADCDSSDIPPASMSIDKLIKNIPTYISGISSIKFDDGKWEIKTVNVAKKTSDQEVRPTGKFIKAKYMLTVAVGLDPIGNPEYDNDEQLPPNYSSLTGAIESVRKAAPEAIIKSIEFDDGSWEVEAFIKNADTAKTNLMQEMKYTVNPVNSVITKSQIDN